MRNKWAAVAGVCFLDLIAGAFILHMRAASAKVERQIVEDTHTASCTQPSLIEHAIKTATANVQPGNRGITVEGADYRPNPTYDVSQTTYQCLASLKTSVGDLSMKYGWVVANNQLVVRIGID